MKPLYIFDLDGTLALIDHRRHLVERPTCASCSTTNDTQLKRHCNVCQTFKPDWKAFFKACVHDQPNIPVITTLESLVRSKAEVWIWSGRSAEVMNETLSWLHRNLPDSIDFDKLQLCMRLEGDYTPDDELKAGWLDFMDPADRERLVAIFDDRDKAVAMWRAKGVACFQVAPGDF